MKSLIAAALGVAAMTTVALAGEPARLSADQLDRVTAGRAFGSYSLLSIANGTNTSTTSATGTAAATTTTTSTAGGTSSANTATITGSASSGST